MNKTGKITILFLIHIVTTGCTGQLSKPSDIAEETVKTYLNKTDWVYSDDKEIAMQTMTDKLEYEESESIFFKIEQKNNTDKAIEIPPFLMRMNLYTCGIPFTIRGPEGSYYIDNHHKNTINYKYSGPCKSMPPPKPVTVEPGKTISQIYIFSRELWEGIDINGEYFITPRGIEKLTVKIRRK